MSYTPHGLAKYLNRLVFVYKKPKCAPAKADARLQMAFLAEAPLPLMAAASPDQPLYFIDAAHPPSILDRRTHTGRPAFGWMRKGESKELPSNHGRSNLNINGALSWPDKTIVYREEERITSSAQIALINDLLERHPTATAIRVVMDNARCNHAKELRAFLADAGKRIIPIYLPSYAPNLNLSERFWLFCKKKALWSRYYPTFVDFREAIRNVFRSLGSFSDELEALLTPNFHIIGEPKNRILPA